MSHPKCNLTPQEREHAFGLFGWPYLEELNAAKRFFKKYIFFETWGRRNFREVFCPECGRFAIEKGSMLDVYQDDFFSYHHGDMIQCPQCGTEGELVCLGRMKTMESLRQEKRVVIFREAEGDLIAMAGYMNMSYTFNDLDPYPMWVPSKLYYFAPGKRMEWSQRTCNWFGRCRLTDAEENPWTERAGISEPFPAGGYYYGGYSSDDYYGLIGAGEIRKTSMRYSRMEDYFLGNCAGDPEHTSNVITYLGEYTRRPQLEMLGKLGHTDVIRDLINGNAHTGTVNWRAKTPAAFFRMDKQRYKVFAAVGGTAQDLESWKTDAWYMPFEEFIRLKKLFGEHLHQFLDRFGRSPRRDKLVRWYEGQQHGSQRAWAIWEDTIRLEAELGNDITHDDVLMPKNLWRRHDEVVELRSAMKREQEQELIKSYGHKRYRELKKKFAYTDGVLSIVIPTCAEEIENEGKLLRHCVAGYAERHIKGVKTIVFLRWWDDIHTPYMTIEITPVGGIAQIHGYRNETTGKTMDPHAIHGEFLEEWLTWIEQGSPRTSTGKPIRPRLKEELEVSA
ncbi:MAG: PcfJ domain-containing protein [Oscillibacter sp.]|nr:PcfJ domain-containing protein [Oscillibacter sp.]